MPPTSEPLTPHRPKKSLGQHFLKDRTVSPRIAEAASIQPSDCIIEVGPGEGVLTEELARRLDPGTGKLLAVELDSSLIPVLQARLAGFPHISVIHADVLEVAPGDLSEGRPYKLVANLPYYITSAILRLLDGRDISRIVYVGEQLEVHRLRLEQVAFGDAVAVEA